jgi:hypothetical protein
MTPESFRFARGRCYAAPLRFSDGVEGQSITGSMIY